MKKFFMAMIALMMVFTITNCSMTGKKVNKPVSIAVEEESEWKQHKLTLINNTTHIKFDLCLVIHEVLAPHTKDIDKLCPISLLLGERVTVEVPCCGPIMLYCAAIDTRTNILIYSPQQGPLTVLNMSSDGILEFSDKGMIGAGGAKRVL